MIKVIHVITDMKIGGAGRWLLNFLKHYDKSRFKILVAIPEGSILKSEITGLNIDVIEIKGIGDKSLDAGSVSALRQLFHKEKPQIVHTHASLSARIAAKLAGVKVIILTKHCIDSPKTGLKKAAAAFINNKLSSSVIAVSEAVRQNLLSAGMTPDKVRVIYGGVEEIPKLPPEEISRIRSSYGISEHDIVFGMVARLAEVKGHKYLLQAAGQVLKKNKDIKILLAGTGPLEQQLKKMALDMGIADKVIFTGFIKNIEQIYNIVDVNMITSTTEALCLSLIEGMSVSKPMIGTNVGGVPEVVIHGESGLLIPAKQPEAIEEAMLKLADNSTLRAEMGSRARELMKEKFSAAVMAAEICKLYDAAVR